MKKKYRSISILVIAILLLSVTVVMATQDTIGIARPRKSSSSPLIKRMIADTTSEQDIEFFKSKGCLIRHRLKDATSLDCPEDIIPELNVRESRVFYIIDLNADKQIGADKVWAERIDGTGVKVAVLDTGIDLDHPELQDSYIGGYDYIDNDNVPEDVHGHGSHVSGIITANGVDSDAKGVSPGAGIYMYKVCDASGACYEDDMMAAMEAAVKKKSEDPTLKVMSISIGGGSYTTENCDSDSLAAKVNWVVSNGITVVVAAGNDGKGVSSPGCASGAIAVGAVDKSNNVPYWSGRGPALDIAAPGFNIYSTVINGYGYMSGTSMATPHVSGVVALLLDTNPGLTTSEIKTALYDTANPVNKCYKCTLGWGSYCLRQSEVTCTPEITGVGVVDAYEAYLAVKPTGSECSKDANCDDGLYCNGNEKCQAGVCQAGTPVDCSALGNQCNDGVCNEATNSCEAKPKADGIVCDDGLFCNVGETCQSGVCTGGSARDCNDGEICTTDTCDDTLDTCVNTWPGCGSIDGCCGPECNSGNDKDCAVAVKCWSAEYQYLYINNAQLKKFCKCASGTYGYNSYSYIIKRTTVYYYVDSGDNENWDVSSRSSYLPAYQVVCTNGQTYQTNQDYYYD